tara:strand:- start:28 stop:312 length:285 start_codon:yes stop_codon:yes gene_type:complete
MTKETTKIERNTPGFLGGAFDVFAELRDQTARGLRAWGNVYRGIYKTGKEIADFCADLKSERPIGLDAMQKKAYESGFEAGLQEIAEYRGRHRL